MIGRLPVNSLVKDYRDLEQELLAIQRDNPNAYLKSEELIVNELEDMWYLLPEEERALLKKEHKLRLKRHGRGGV